MGNEPRVEDAMTNEENISLEMGKKTLYDAPTLAKSFFL